LPNFKNCKILILIGGVLEAEGTVSIKLRLKDQRKIMERLDSEMKVLYSDLKNPDLNSEKREKTETEIKKREEILAPIYHQVTMGPLRTSAKKLSCFIIKHFFI
jgi:hypothetical protein